MAAGVGWSYAYEKSRRGGPWLAVLVAFLLFGLVLPLVYVLLGAFYSDGQVSLHWFLRLFTGPTILLAVLIWAMSATIIAAGRFLTMPELDRRRAVVQGLLWAIGPGLVVLFGGMPGPWDLLIALVIAAGVGVAQPALRGRSLSAADIGRAGLWLVGSWSVLTLINGLEAATREQSWLTNSLALAAVVTVLTVVVSLPLALFTIRYRFRGKALLTGLLLLPMIMPPFVGAIGMQRLLSRFGTLNQILMELGLVNAADPVDILGGARFWGIVILQVLHLYPIMYLNLAAALANVDPALEQAARNMGDHGWRLFRRVNLPLIVPGLFAGGSLVFIWSLTDLGTPLVFGYHEVVATRIWDLLQAEGGGGQAFALVVTVLALTLLMFYLTKRALGKQTHTQLYKGTSGGRDQQPSGGLTVLIYACFALVIFLAALPHLAVVLSSFTQRWFMTALPTEFTLQHYETALSHPLTTGSVARSLGYSVASVTIDLVLGLTIAFYATRTGSRVARTADGMAMLPLAIPGIILAFGYVTFYDTVNRTVAGVPVLQDIAYAVHPVHFPVLLLVMSYAIRRLPFMVRAVHAGFQQVPAQYEEASLSLGVGPGRTLRRVTLPLIAANVIAGAILCFSFAMLEVSDSLILAAKSQFYPLTKAIYATFQWLAVGEHVASALGVVGMFILSGSLLLAALFMGRRLGEMFRIT